MILPEELTDALSLLWLKIWNGKRPAQSIIRDYLWILISLHLGLLLALRQLSLLNCARQWSCFVVRPSVTWITAKQCDTCSSPEGLTCYSALRIRVNSGHIKPILHSPYCFPINLKSDDLRSQYSAASRQANWKLGDEECKGCCFVSLYQDNIYLYNGQNSGGTESRGKKKKNQLLEEKKKRVSHRVTTFCFMCRTS